MRSGLFFAVLGASITLATAAAAQDAPKLPPPAAGATPPGPPPGGQPPLPPPPPQSGPGDHGPMPADPWRQPGDHGPMPNDQWHHPDLNGPPGPMPNDAWHHPERGPGGPMEGNGPMAGHQMPGGMMMHDMIQNHVQVTVDSGDKPVVLERRVKKEEMEGRTMFLIPRNQTTETWEQVCVSPCTLHLDRASTYRISRENFVTQSGTFLMPSQGEQVKINVKPGNWWWHNAGMKVVGAGTVAGITGAALISLAPTWDSHHAEKHVRATGIITASAGALLLAIGIPIALKTKTTVTIGDKKVGEAQPTKPPAPKLTIDGFVF